MSLISDAMESMTMMVKTTAPDSEGDRITNWVPSSKFSAAVTLDSSMQAKIAEKQGVTGVYSVYTGRSTVLEYHNVFRRESDGMVFRVTSRSGNDTKTSNFATLDLNKVSAEEWTLN